MKILLIGGSGRLGKMLCQRLSGHDVTTLSRRELNTENAKHISGDILTFKDYSGFDVVVNCAAMKDVAKCEERVEECVEINYHGTFTSLNESIRCGVKRYVYISTDMASEVNSVYGASKLLADALVVNAAKAGVIQTCVIRLGNIIAKSGSIFTLFEQKASELGHIPITDAGMTRFLMRDSECADFVIETICSDTLSGEIYAPRCKAYRIGDIATAVAPDIEQRIVGLRPGDALSVVMVAQREAHRTEIRGDRYVIHPQWCALNFSDVDSQISSANNYAYATVEELRQLYCELMAN